MTPTEAAIRRLNIACFTGMDNPTNEDVMLLLAQRDRYEKALREIRDELDGHGVVNMHWLENFVKEALRCE